MRALLKKSKASEEQIVTALTKVGAGLSVRELGRQLMVSDATVYPH